MKKRVFIVSALASAMLCTAGGAMAQDSKDGTDDGLEQMGAADTGIHAQTGHPVAVVR